MKQNNALKENVSIRMISSAVNYIHQRRREQSSIKNGDESANVIEVFLEVDSDNILKYLNE